MKILTGIDLPFEPSCGSMILCDDLYRNLPIDVNVRFLSLKSEICDPSWSQMKDIQILDVPKVTDEKEYEKYVTKLYEKIEESINQFQPDIIHIQHLSFGMALAFAKVRDLPKIAICHGTDVLYSINNSFHRNNVRKVCESSDFVIFPTSQMYEDFKRIIGIELGTKTKVIYWGIPEVINDIRIKKVDKSKIELLYAGRLTSDKGVDVILNSLSKLPDNFRLTIIGSGTAEENLKLLVDELKLKSKVEFIPFMSRTELWKQFQKFDAIIISTKEIESFCLVAIEAQAHGLQAVYSNTSGLIEVVGDSGVSFVPNDPVSLTKSIEYLFEDQNYDLFLEKSFNNAKKFQVVTTLSQLLDLSKSII